MYISGLNHSFLIQNVPGLSRGQPQITLQNYKGNLFFTKPYKRKKIGFQFQLPNYMKAG